MKDLCSTSPSTGKGSTKRVLAVLLLAVLLALMTCAFFTPAAGADVTSEKAHGKTVVVVIDRIGLDDIGPAVAPNYIRLMSRGAFGLMNARVKYDLYGLGSYLVIGSGGRAIGGQNTGLAFDSSELLKTTTDEAVPAGRIYKTRTGRDAPSAGVVNLFIEEMRKKSDTNLATSKPGVLGQQLRNSGRKVAVLGNADSELPDVPLDLAPVPVDTRSVPAPAVRLAAGSQGPYYPLMSFIHREVSAICMSGKGVISQGDVSRSVVKRDADGNLATDFQALEAKAFQLLPLSDVMVIDMGQTSRVDEQYDFTSSAQLGKMRQKAIRECDSSLGRIASMLDLSRDTLVVCTPTPTRKMVLGGELLTPLLVCGKGYASGRQLSSSTTRRTGLVSSYDIAPTVLDSQGLKLPAEMNGSVLSSKGSATGLKKLRGERDRAVAAYNSRKALVRVYVITAMCVIALFFLVVLIRRDLVTDHPIFWAAALLALLAGPFAWLAVPAFGTLPQGAAIAVAVGLSILLALASLLLRQRKDGPGTLVSAFTRPVLALSSITLMLILLDTALGSPLMRLSAFGSDAVLGDRYYGIGNLYMGFAIGAAVVVACLGVYCYPSVFDAPWKRYTFAGVVLAVTTIFIGFPRLGANVGGLAACSLASLVAIIKLEGQKVTLKRAAIAVVALVVIIAGVMLLDSVLPGAATHAGRAVSKVKTGGFGTMTAQAARKLGANWMLTFASIWRLLLLFGVVAWLVLNWRFAALKSIRKSPALYAAFVALAVGLVFGWFFNDSGIEAAGAISVFLFVPFFLMLIPWRPGGRPPEA